ncbi:MAG: Plug domain-containing protein, partial [Gemmatimonadota bacterium]|nr:Plug domain-containing protein [Gemmatimonadota bacterium]
MATSRLPAQVVPADVANTPIPVKPPTDSAGADTTLAKPDSIQPQVGRFADPILYGIGPQYQWNRRELFATGALTVADLLDRIPQITTYRSGWLATPQTAAFNGDFQRVRIFYDGIEIDNLDPENGGLLDLSTVQLWTLEHVSVERSASEARVYLRSWRVEDTTPYTRVDVATGNEETNLYRGYYGKRFSRGELLQLAGQQFGVRSSRFAGTGDALSVLARAGVGRKGWSVDAFINRTHATRGIQRPALGRPNIPALDARHTTAYMRLAVGSPRGPWAQASATSLGFNASEAVTTVGEDGVSVTDTVPTTRSEAQYDLSGGITRGPARLELRDKVRAINGETYNSLSARLDVALPWVLLSGFVENDGFRRSTNADIGARFQPLSFIAFSGSVAQTTARSDNATFPSSRAARGEVGLRIIGPWLTIGAMTLDNAFVPAPVVYDTLLLPISLGRSEGIIAGIRGPLGRG